MVNFTTRKTRRFCFINRKNVFSKNFVEQAFKNIDIDIEWVDEGINEKGIDKKNGKCLVKWIHVILGQLMNNF